MMLLIHTENSATAWVSRCSLPYTNEPVTASHYRIGSAWDPRGRTSCSTAAQATWHEAPSACARL